VDQTREREAELVKQKILLDDQIRHLTSESLVLEKEIQAEFRVQSLQNAGGLH